MTSPPRYGTPEFESAITLHPDPTVRQVISLAAELCTVPSVTVPAAAADFAALARAARIAGEYAAGQGLRVYTPDVSDDAPYPFVLVTFAEHALEHPSTTEAVALIGHLDVVPPQEEDQFSPFMDGFDLYARGAADMKCVVASYLVWMAQWQARPGPKPPILLMLSCCEENGSEKPNNITSVLYWLRQQFDLEIRFAVVGERTGELEWMNPEMVIGTICRENRSWRWIRAESPSAHGAEALQRIAGTVELGRTAIHRLNETQTPEAKKKRQPGLRSGLVNPFCFVAGDLGSHNPSDLVWLCAERSAGASVHSAAAQISQPSLVEIFFSVQQKAALEFGANRVYLAGVEIGQDSNFNTYDGSGLMKLAVADIGVEDLTQWASQIEQPSILFEAGTKPVEITRGHTVVGLDIRELLDHRVDVEKLLSSLPAHLFGQDGFRVILDAPSWQCPEDNPDLVKLIAAYEEVVGHSSPDLVKLHGNDGGHLVAFLQTAKEEGLQPGLGPVVVFGQVGMRPHGRGEFHRTTSIRPYLDVLDRWAIALCKPA